MLQKLQHHINNNLPFLKDKKLLIAISGGVDSVVLTHLLSSLNFNISLAHCNFNLRGKESDLDEDFVADLAKKLKIESHIAQICINPVGSIQLAARELRYEWFQDLIEKHSYDFVLTAHHADDNLETFLINLTRGSGLDGFTGIPEKNNHIVRPLLPFSRASIVMFAKENNITWREDLSNASTKYTRNKIRHKIAPVLKEINPNLLESFAKTIAHLKQSQQLVKDRIEEISARIITKEKANGNKIIKLNIAEINKLSDPKAYLYQLLKKYKFKAFHDVYNLLSAQSGKKVLSKKHVLLKDRGFLILSKKTIGITKATDEYEIQENTSEIIKPIHLTFEEVTNLSEKNNNTIYVAKEKLSYPLIVRKWQNGDYFYPSGMQGKKKLSKYFKDEKLSLLEKEQTWLLCNRDNKILWVIGKRQDQRFQSKTTINRLKITLK
ncbi:tRNA lysidine(34) synthetase TilS [uncultured Polaribacter sp.]|uniref:tRNA lysidine(34) synthetase TilS n=1 Tax=uncultured Polaribacter sp. TaxID=174711 RepID=UPI0026106F30|nr:tRNA lysidine(34) synthetase TilS [uncultured Polaribacter sp.]